MTTARHFQFSPRMATVFKIFLALTLLATASEALSVYPPDFYNLDIQNFRFFKHQGRPPQPVRYGVRPIYPEPSLPEKGKAVYTYFRNLFLGHPVQQNTYQIVFDPERGQRLREAYQRQFGYRGENLIAYIGNGHSPRELRYHGAIGREFGRY
ncbi:uncharacterized protein LOC120430953 [Culex pipiens pallens]|nr:uncharacterized protein LOC120430953 [Culex pipiens pallens]